MQLGALILVALGFLAWRHVRESDWRKPFQNRLWAWKELWKR